MVEEVCYLLREGVECPYEIKEIENCHGTSCDEYITFTEVIDFFGGLARNSPYTFHRKMVEEIKE